MAQAGPIGRETKHPPIRLFKIAGKLAFLKYPASIIALICVLYRHTDPTPLTNPDYLLFTVLLAFAGITWYTSPLRSGMIRVGTGWLHLMTFGSALCIIAAVYFFLEYTAKSGWLPSANAWLSESYFSIIPKDPSTNQPLSLDISVPNIALSLFLTSIAVVTWSSSGKQKFCPYDFRAFYKVSLQFFVIAAVFALTIYSWVIELKYLSMIACMILFAYTVTTTLFCYTAQSVNATLRGIHDKLTRSLFRAQGALVCQSSVCTCSIPHEGSRKFFSKDEKEWSQPRWLFRVKRALYSRISGPIAARIKLNCPAVRAACCSDSNAEFTTQCGTYKVDCPWVRAFFQEFSDNAEMQWAAYKQDESPAHAERLAIITHNLIKEIEAGWFQQPAFAFLTGFHTVPRSVEDKYHEAYLNYLERFLVEFMHMSVTSNANINAVCALGCLFRLIQREDSPATENVQVHTYKPFTRVLYAGLNEIQLAGGFNPFFYSSLVLVSCLPREIAYLDRLILHLPAEAHDSLTEWALLNRMTFDDAHSQLLWELSCYCSFMAGNANQYRSRHSVVCEVLKRLQPIQSGKGGPAPVDDGHCQEAPEIKKSSREVSV